MIKITLEDINRKSPYEVTFNNGDFDFTTDSGTRYSVSFLEDVPIVGDFKQTAESLTGEKP